MPITLETLHKLLAATEKLKVIAAILPGPWSPVLAAKQLATIDQFTNGRVAVNIVSGWFKGEFRAIGEPWLEHDEHYRRSEEFIQALKGIWTQDNFDWKLVRCIRHLYVLELANSKTVVFTHLVGSR